MAMKWAMIMWLNCTSLFNLYVHHRLAITTTRLVAPCTQHVAVQLSDNTLPTGPVLRVKDLRGKELQVLEPDAANLGEVLDEPPDHAVDPDPQRHQAVVTMRALPLEGGRQCPR
eukprot:1342798-Rhodomonas_salina.2